MPIDLKFLILKLESVPHVSFFHALQIKGDFSISRSLIFDQ
ncbi:MAG: hypothetical protein E5299_01003 [Burkholderia gladioli]|nr:MAG: hypothetical protein E5299_01003 [Burkholderia gladioli]